MWNTTHLLTNETWAAPTQVSSPKQKRTKNNFRFENQTIQIIDHSFSLPADSLPEQMGYEKECVRLKILSNVASISTSSTLPKA